MRTAFTAAGLLATTTLAVQQAELDFFNYMVEWGKSYDSVEEFAMRLALWQKTERFI